MSILQDIYDETYTPGEAAEKLPASLRLERRTFWEAIEKSMGEEFMEHHWDGLCRIERFRDYANFREGFRLGVSLMTELL